MPTTRQIIEKKVQLFESCELSIGEPCIPYTLTKSAVTLDRNTEERKVQIFGRKIPLVDIHARLMKQHEQYMRLTTNKEFQVMKRSELLSQATMWHVCLPSDVSDNELCDQLAQAE